MIPIDESLSNLREVIETCQSPDSGKNRDCRQAFQEFESSIKHLTMLMPALDSSGEAVLILDENCAPAYINMAFGYLFKTTPETLCHSDVSRLFESLPAQISTVLSPEGDFSGSCETVMSSLSGQEFIASIRGTKIMSQDLDFMGCFFIIQDITEKKRSEEELHRHREHLEELVNNRTDEINAAKERLVLEVAESRRLEAVLREKTAQLEREDWIKTGVMALREALTGDSDMDSFAPKALAHMARYIDAQLGAVYIRKGFNDEIFSLAGTYAWSHKDGACPAFGPGEGIPGQAIIEKRLILLKDLPEGYFRISSSLGGMSPRNLCVVPALLNDRAMGVVELGTHGEITEIQKDYLIRSAAVLAVAIESAHSWMTRTRLLEETLHSEEMQVQQEELKILNEELQEQTRCLRLSEEMLKNQQEELQVINEELAEKNLLLENQKKELEGAERKISEKAEALAKANRYKSEFLATMSHELRSPLNSLLLLAQNLIRNKTGNLTPEQVESARIIHCSGTDLLNLINELLDLSKIEAGRMDIIPGKIAVAGIADSASMTFRHVAKDKGIEFEAVVAETAPAEITSDRKLVDQVVRNLVANAIKFTEKGKVTLTFSRPSRSVVFSRITCPHEECIQISVEDTGIGIPLEKQRAVFEAFYQIDAGSARKFAGTGLGLSISNKLATLLGGEIRLESIPGRGSTFSFFLPVTFSETVSQEPPGGDLQGEQRTEKGIQNIVPTEKGIQNIVPTERSDDDRLILAIERDPDIARLLFDKCREKNFNCLVTHSGEEGLALSVKHRPNAILLGCGLSDPDCLMVKESLRENSRTRDIPVHLISKAREIEAPLVKGTRGYHSPSLDPEEIEELFLRLEGFWPLKPGRVLVVEDDSVTRNGIVDLLEGSDACTEEAENGAKALEMLRTRHYHCLILDLGLPDMNGIEFLAIAEREGIKLPPVVVHTARDLTMEEEMELHEHTRSIVIKNSLSMNRLLDEVSVFLHRVSREMPEEESGAATDTKAVDAFLEGRKILIVDDDMRTTFALSRQLSDLGMKTMKADNGETALKILDQEPGVDLVLMDIMMPVMDGYETIRRIRAQAKFKKMPILVLSAKAMTKDRENCLEIGANDYLPKPVDIGKLVSMMRVWLYN